MNQFKNIIMSVMLSALLAACVVVTPQTVTKLLNGHSEDKIERAILDSGKVRGWKMTKIRNGLIKGTIDVRGHQAEINIPYSQGKYSIEYVSGSRSATDKNPPKNYGRWAGKLTGDIEKRLNPPQYR